MNRAPGCRFAPRRRHSSAARCAVSGAARPSAMLDACTSSNSRPSSSACCSTSRASSSTISMEMTLPLEQCGQRGAEIVVDARLSHVIARAGVADIENAFLVIVTADSEHGDCRLAALELPGRLDAVELWHLDVHHDRVGLQLARELDRLTAVVRAADNFEPLVAREHLFEHGEEVLVVF